MQRQRRPGRHPVSDLGFLMFIFFNGATAWLNNVGDVKAPCDKKRRKKEKKDRKKEKGGGKGEKKPLVTSQTATFQKLRALAHAF